MAMTAILEAEDPRVVRTRDLLKGAMVALMREKSWREISVGDITQRATVNRTTFYAHFDDKDALLESCLRDKCRRALAEVGSLRRDRVGEDLRRLVGAVFEFFAQLPIQCPIAIRQWEPIVVRAMQEELERMLGCWLGQIASPNSQADRGAIVAALSGAIVASGVRWLRRDESLSTQQGADSVAAMLLPGVLALRPSEELMPRSRE
ncbi:MAG: TetR/AcrR family transcriptional regulator [Capsulimonas sp.]|uniref:TetR/AcrR family transcriptional regulator n=1 Tax=Capsulimonas sp. TaxID=2494211 RepID=UPI003267F716